MFSMKLLLLILYNGIVWSLEDNENQCTAFENQGDKNVTSSCEYTVIFDLSKTFMGDDIFDNIFIPFLLTYPTNVDCKKNQLTLVSTNPKFDKISCHGFEKCADVFGDLNFDIIATVYNDQLVEDNSATVEKYSAFLNDTLSEILPCGENSVILLTNRIVNVTEFFKDSLEAILDNSCQLLIIILLGRNESDATSTLSQLYENVENVKFFNIADYDCVIYLYYCILPCQKDVVFGCLQSSLEDCAESPISINNSPGSTWEVWYIFLFSKNNMTTANLQSVFSSILSGIRLHYYSALRIKFIINSTFVHSVFEMNVDEHILSPIEDLLGNITMEETGIDMEDVIGLDGNEMNNRFKLAPSLEMINKMRDFPKVIALTNYAATNFETTNKNAVVHVYNNEAYKYFCQNVTYNSDDLQFQLTKFDDEIMINPLDGNTIPPDASTVTTDDFSETTETQTSESSRSSSTLENTLPSTSPSMFPPTIASSTQKPSTSTTLFTSHGTSLPSSSSFTTVTSTTTKSTSENQKSSTILIICGSIGGILSIIAVILIFVICKRRKQKKHVRKFLTKSIFDQLITNNPVLNQTQLSQPSEIEEDLELTWNKLILKNSILGSGAYGQIVRGKLLNRTKNGIYEDDMIDVAIKTPQKTAPESVKGDLLNEIALMKLINGHKNVVKMIGCITIGDRIALILEFCRYRDLLNYCKALKIDTKKSKKIRKRSAKEFLLFSWQICNGMQFLASHGIIHRDIAARNILIDADKNAKISDFGLSIRQNENTENIVSKIEAGRVPIKWLAIESLKNCEFSFKSDIWSFGILLIEMYSFGEIPFAEIETSNLLEHLEAENRMEKPEFCCNEIYNIMRNCWNSMPSSRPSIKELINYFYKLLESSTKSYGYLELLNE